MADEIEAGKSFHDVVKSFMSEHQRIIFNGDGYSKEWEEEAARRGLANNKNTVDAVSCLKEEKYIEMLDSLGVYSRVELASRYEILLDNYAKTMKVEALTSLKMVKTQIYPAGCSYLSVLTKEATSLKSLEVDHSYLMDDVQYISSLLKEIKEKMTTLEKSIEKTQNEVSDIFKIAKMWHEEVFMNMQSLRETVDLLEENMDQKYWPMPNYVDLLYGI